MTTPAEFVDPYALVAEALSRPREAITVDSAIYRVHGWDSLGHIALLLSLQKSYGIPFDEAAAEKYTTMRAIIDLYDRLRSSGNA